MRGCWRFIRKRSAKRGDLALHAFIQLVDTGKYVAEIGWRLGRTIEKALQTAVGFGCVGLAGLFSRHKGLRELALRLFDLRRVEGLSIDPGHPRLCIRVLTSIDLERGVLPACL